MPVVIIIIALAVVGGGVFLLQSNNEVPIQEEQVTEELMGEDAMKEDGEAMAEDEQSSDDDHSGDDAMMEEKEGDGAMMEESGAFNDGTYEAKATYRTPKQTTHDIEVSLTIADDTVTAVDVVYDGSEGFSNGFQEGFDGAVEGLVIGKKLDEIDLGRTGGSSLTPEAFNEAVEEIANEARA